MSPVFVFSDCRVRVAIYQEKANTDTCHLIEGKGLDMIRQPHLSRIRLNVRAPVLVPLTVLMVWATSASAQVNLLLNRDYVGNASEKQLLRVIDKHVDLNEVSWCYGHTPLTVMAHYRQCKNPKGTM